MGSFRKPWERTTIADVLVLCQESVAPFDDRSRAGHRHDDHDRRGEEDHKIIAIATGDPEYDHYWEAAELPPHKMAMVRRFFLDYKKLEGKSVQVERSNRRKRRIL